MIPSTPNIRTLFDRAAEITDPAGRRGLSGRACAGAPDVRREVERPAGPAPGRRLPGGPGPAPAALPADVRADPLGDARGADRRPYQGSSGSSARAGWATVWMAEQTSRSSRQVAVKLIKAGMDSGTVLARFEAERQALALMDHPNIAKVLDGGHDRPTAGRSSSWNWSRACRSPSTATTAQLTRRASGWSCSRQVCQAVQHAHQKGIIHRDLKPTNILVDEPRRQAGAEGDRLRPGQGDRAAAADRADACSPRSGRVVGHAAVHGPGAGRRSAPLDVDTRADVYALGVILYELLTGTTPIERERLAEGGLGRDAAGDPRGGAARPEQPAEHVGGAPGVAAAAADGAGEAGPVRPRRARLDRDEGPGQGARPAVQDRPRPWP